MAGVLYLPDLAARFGKTEAAMRGLIQRKSPDVPTPFRIGGRLAWWAQDVDRHLEQLAAGQRPPRPGRPRKNS